MTVRKRQANKGIVETSQESAKPQPQTMKGGEPGGCNVKTVRQYCEKQSGIVLHGCFGEFTYITIWMPRSNSRCKKYEALAAGSDA